MSYEIEHKFLVVSDTYRAMAKQHFTIYQGYITTQSGVTVRIRTKDDKGYLTIKGKSFDGGLSRYEWEKEIPLSEAKTLLTLCDTPLIEKTRYLVEYEGHTFEVDEFYGANEGLILAELEVKNPDEKFKIPSFIGDEVTGLLSYYNSYLSRHPYKEWSKI